MLIISACLAASLFFQLSPVIYRKEELTPMVCTMLVSLFPPPQLMIPYVFFCFYSHVAGDMTQVHFNPLGFPFPSHNTKN